MPESHTKTEQNTQTVSFQKTPVMSTYLLYFGVGSFDFIETKYKGKKIRVITTPGKAKEGRLALDLTKKFLKYFEDFSKVPYPLPKLDLIAIPDFNAGAMENWGAITFREIALLFDQKKSSITAKKRIAEVIAHELWHQWSGNLVTMEWWNDLWLNESFATYMAYKAVNNYYPEWYMWHDFVGSETAWAFKEDSLKNTHPIAVPVSSPNEIEEIFDGISYGKGGSVLRMINSYLGEKAFQKGISNYLKKYKYKNTIASQLWNELSKVSKDPIKQVMTSWIQQPGHPIIKVSRSKDALSLTQHKFNAQSKDKTLWKIPLTIQTPKKEIKTLFTTKSKTITLPKDTKWYKLNIDQKGFYRVQYDKQSLKALKSLISQKKFSSLDRAGLQGDLFNTTVSGEETLSTYLDFIKAYKNEDNQFVLSDIYLNLYKIYYTFSEEPHWPKIWPQFKTHLREPFENNFKKLTWIMENMLIKIQFQILRLPFQAVRSLRCAHLMSN